MTKNRFGCQLPQEENNFEKLAEIAEDCEQLGYDSIWAFDHLAPYWNQRGQALECFTLLAAVAQRTKKIKLGSLVANVNVRNPALLAKITSSLDNLSDGRLILGLGTGDRMSRNELLAYGYSFASVDERVEHLRESALILKEMWTKDQATFEGKYHRVVSAVNYPKPIQKPHPPLWIGGKHPKILDVVAEMADGWNYWGITKEMLAQRTRYLSDKCATIGRQPQQITKSWAGTLAHLTKSNIGRDELMENIRDQIRRQTDDQTKYFIASFGSRADPSIYETFAEVIQSLD